MDSAIKALVIQQALIQRARAIGIDTELANGDITAQNNETEDETLTRVLIEREVHTPPRQRGRLPALLRR